MSFRKIFLLSTLLSVAILSVTAQETESPRISVTGMMNLGMRLLFLDTAYWNALVPDPSLPTLPAGPAIMHGASFYADFTDWFRLGLQGWGIVHGTYLETGLTEFAGAILGLYGEFRYQLPWRFQGVFAGGVLSCGRFYFNSITQAGTGIRASSGAVYFEPYVGTGFALFNIILIRASVSYIFPILFQNDLWMGPGGPLAVNPGGFILTFTFGFPLLSIR
jgi:hypothetical protein